MAVRKTNRSDWCVHEMAMWGVEGSMAGMRVWITTREEQMSEQNFETTKRFFYPDNSAAKALIEQAKDLDELKTIILQHHIGLQGRSQYFDANMLIMCIDRYLHDGDISHLTSAGNFRFTVIRLKRK